jgi:hypothetical protein
LNVDRADPWLELRGDYSAASSGLSANCCIQHLQFTTDDLKQISWKTLQGLAVEGRFCPLVFEAFDHTTECIGF